MKSLMWVLVVTIMLIGQQAFAEASGPDFYQIKADLAAGKTIPIYRDHSLNSEVVSDNVPRATQLKNLGCWGTPDFQTWSSMDEPARAKAKDNAWCKVSYEGYEGWVKNIYLAEYTEPMGPAFDCEKAKGSIETLVCNEPELGHLDRKMDAVYREALARAESLGDQPQKAVNFLKATQRGWIKGRNDCWKAEDKFVCTKNEYERRQSMLQATWSLVGASEPARYVCADQREEFYVISYETDALPAVAVEYGDSRQAMVLLSDSLYTGDRGRSVKLEGEQATLTWDPYKPQKVCHRQ